MDVHPPLAKMLIALVGWLAGFNGDFDFKEIGKDYLEPGVPYVAMRLLPAIMGIMVVPLMFLTLKAAGCSTATATLGAGLITFGTNFEPFQVLLLLRLLCRKWPCHPSTLNSIRLSLGFLHFCNCTIMDFFSQCP